MATTFRNEKLFCLNCGNEKAIPMPMVISEMTKMMESFESQHKNCKPEWKQPIPDKSLSEYDRIKFWYEHGEHGISSQTMYDKMAYPRFHSNGHPSDPDDFRRCYLLIRDFVPEWKKKLHLMREVSTQWDNIIENWKELSEMMERLLSGEKSDAVPMYAFMKKLGL